MNIYQEQTSNIVKTWFLMTIFFVVVIALGFAFSVVYNNQAILYFAVIFSLLMNIGAYWFSDKLVLKLYRAVPATRDEHRELWNIVENLAITAGLPMPRLYIIPDPAPNAFATGRNREHAVIGVTSGLLQLLNRTELEGVIAHELSHIGNRDMLLSTVIVVLVGFIALLSDMFLRMSLFGGHRSSNNEKGNAGQIIAIIGIVLAILSPIIAIIMQLAISRKREFLADASGALLTRYPEGLANALIKIGAYSGGQMMRANNATAHLFISNPFGLGASDGSGAQGVVSQGRGSFLRGLFMTHPPVAQRVSILRGMKDKV